MRLRDVVVVAVVLAQSFLTIKKLDKIRCNRATYISSKDRGGAFVNNWNTSQSRWLRFSFDLHSGSLFLLAQLIRKSFLILLFFSTQSRSSTTSGFSGSSRQTQGGGKGYCAGNRNLNPMGRVRLCNWMGSLPLIMITLYFCWPVKLMETTAHSTAQFRQRKASKSALN